MSRTIEAIIKPTGATSEKKSASATSQTMKAIRIHNYGGPKVLHYEDAPRPKPQAGEVLVRVHAAGVNPIDWKVREGYMKDFWPHKFPLILGWDLSGVVEELGPDPAAAGRFKIGVDEPKAYTQHRFGEKAVKVDIVRHTRGDETQDRSWSVVKKGGVLVSLVQPPSEEKAKEVGVRAAILGARPSGEQLSEVAKI